MRLLTGFFFAFYASFFLRSNRRRRYGKKQKVWFKDQKKDQNQSQNQDQEI